MLNVSEEKYCIVCCKKLRKTGSYKYEAEGKKGNLCDKHHYQLKRYGHFLDETPITTQDQNRYLLDDKVAWIITTDVRQNENGRFKIDADDLERVLKHKWRRLHNRYVCKYENRQIDVGCLIMGKLEKGYDKVVDHINNDTSDNRKINLRIIDQTKNLMNRRPFKNKKTSVVGVHQGKICCQAYISYYKKKIYLGTFNYFDAVYARYYAELLLFKECRNTANDDLVQEIIQQCSNKEEIRRRVEERIAKVLGPIEEVA